MSDSKRGHDTIEAGWLSFSMSLPDNLPPLQMDAMRIAFFSGAGHLLDLMTGEPNRREPTEADFLMMKGIDAELDRFLDDCKLKSTRVVGNA
jgi:hypothetical protein